ncbi:MAG: enoyl-CoA hydratase-related protein [Streptosporangiaceae bacterium]
MPYDLVAGDRGTELEAAVADVVCKQRDSVALVTLNRPARRNALSGALLAALRATLAELDAQPGVRAIVLTGAEPAFCAEQVTGEAAAGIEGRARARWHTAGIDRVEVARRRDAVIERGRSQAGTS